MELSEALKAVRFIKPGKDYVLFAHGWMPTAVTLGKARYPTPDQVLEQLRRAGANVHYLDPSKLPFFAGAPLPANIYTLGAVMGRTGLRALIDPSQILDLLKKRWTRGVERNRRAFDAGMRTACAP
jgi:indolepyruvate ferredoxin oxidoreductase beta subunit